MLNKVLKGHLDTLEKDPDIKYLKGVTPATLFRFLNGSVHLDNIRKPAVNSVLIAFEDLDNRELLLPFFADMRYRGIALKTDAFKRSLLGNYLKIYYPMHLKANMYHDDFITKQISMIEKCILLCDNSAPSDELIVTNESDSKRRSYSFFPTVHNSFSMETGQYKEFISDIKGKGMDSLYGVNHEMVDVLMDFVRKGMAYVMNLCEASTQPKPVLEYALVLYKESQNDAKIFSSNFDSNNYNETRRVLEKKIAFDTVFVYLLLSELRTVLPKNHMLCCKGRLRPERPTIFYLSSRFSMRSDTVLNLQKQIIMKCILFSTLSRLEKDDGKRYGFADLHSDIGSHFGWLDTNDDRRYVRIQQLLDLKVNSPCLVDELFRARNPVP